MNVQYEIEKTIGFVSGCLFCVWAFFEPYLASLLNC
ncbi:hypothetical protein PARMER_01444 [Parabacteroides merdae ATCC 43184]|nr:hypothetical protein PARMER_01444 [Parabacteroides merdae ATCC 43184]